VNPGTESHKLPPLIIDADGLKLLAKNSDWETPAF
jgi:NAD(P)H-hydrate repair Nnr-like enzyme with NAD(P)H-hydrate dehydratase domain